MSRIFEEGDLYWKCDYDVGSGVAITSKRFSGRMLETDRYEDKRGNRVFEQCGNLEEDDGITAGERQFEH